MEALLQALEVSADSMLSDLKARLGAVTAEAARDLAKIQERATALIEENPRAERVVLHRLRRRHAALLERVERLQDLLDVEARLALLALQEASTLAHVLLSRYRHETRPLSLMFSDLGLPYPPASGPLARA